MPQCAFCCFLNPIWKRCKDSAVRAIIAPFSRASRFESGSWDSSLLCINTRVFAKLWWSALHWKISIPKELIDTNMIARSRYFRIFFFVKNFCIRLSIFLHRVMVLYTVFSSTGGLSSSVVRTSGTTDFDIFGRTSSSGEASNQDTVLI